MKKAYYSVRAGKHPTGGRLDLNGIKYLADSAFSQFWERGYFQEVFGHNCVDAGLIPGRAGTDIKAFFFNKLRRHDIWPIAENIKDYDEGDLFDVIELLHDCVSRPIGGNFHSWNECGWHYETFDQQAGQKEFRASMNEILRDYKIGYELTANGEIVSLAPRGLGDLERAPAPPADPENVLARMNAAIDKFRRRDATSDDRRDAVRDLADILEFLRPRARKILTTKDEAELFDLANNFGIRHHNSKQKTAYDKPIWLSWMFYHYLATIHALTRLIEKASQQNRR